MVVQLSQAALAVKPGISTDYSGLNGIGGDLFGQSLINNQPIKSTTQIPDSASNLQISTKQPMLTFNSSALLESGRAADNTNNPIARAGFVTQTNYISLDSGNILVSPDKDIIIGTQEGVVSIGSGAAIFVMESGIDTVIYDLYQARPEQVSVVVNKHKLVMQPGCMLVLTKEKTKDFEQLAANCHSISYRRAQEIDLKEDTINAFVANFSIFSALVKIQPLKELVDSKDRKDQQLLNKLLKSAVMLRT